MAAAKEPDKTNDATALIFKAGSGFLKNTHGISYQTDDSNSVTLMAYFLGTAKEASYAEIPITKIDSGVGLAKADAITSFKVASSDKSVKASYDKKNDVIKVTTSSVGRGTITVTATLKENKQSTTYAATLNYVVVPPQPEYTEIGYKKKGEKETTYTKNLLSYEMEVGQSLAVELRFYAPGFGYYTYGGKKNSGVWQSLDPSYLSVTTDGKIKALTATPGEEKARAVFIDYCGNMNTTVEVKIKPKANTKLDGWKDTLLFRYKGTAKGSTEQSVEPSKSVTWQLADGPFQLTTVVKDTKSGKEVKPKVFYYSTQPQIVACDSKGKCYPLQASGTVTTAIYAVALDSADQIRQKSFSITIR